MKKLLFACLAIAAIACMATPASAVLNLTAGNTTMAAELIDSTANSFTNKPSGFTVSFTPGSNLNIGQGITFTLDNGARFAVPAAGLNLCVGAVQVAGPAVINPAQRIATFTLTAPLTAADNATISDAACAAPVAPTIQIAAGTAVDTVLHLSTNGTGADVGNPNIVAVAPAVTIKQQFSFKGTNGIDPVTSTLTFASNLTQFNPAGTAVPPRTTALLSQAGFAIVNDVTITDRVAVGGAIACQHTLAPADATLAITVTGDLSGLDQLGFGPPAGVTTTAVIGAAERTARSITMNVTGANLNICNSNETIDNRALELRSANGAVGAGSIALGPRNATITFSGNVAGAVKNATTRTAVSNQVSHIFASDATQVIIPQINTNTTVNTVCLVNNPSNLAGAVNVEVISSEGATGLTTTPLSLGTLPAQSSAQVTFNGNTVTLTGGLGPVTLTVGVNKRFSARLNMAMASANLSVNCQQTIQSPAGFTRTILPAFFAVGSNPHPAF